MSNILSINTVGSGTQISLQKSNEVFCCSVPFAKHSETLFPTLEKFLSEKNIQLKDLDALGVVTGPGSFTGIRIGMSVVKAFSYVFDTPIVTVNSLEVLAQGVSFDKNTKFCVTMNAGAEQVYYQVFEYVDNKINSITPPRVSEIKHFLNFCDVSPNMQIFCVDAVLDNTKLNTNPINFTPEGLNKIVLNHYMQGDIHTTNDVQPIYLRLAQGEVCHIVPEKLSFVRAMSTEAVALASVDNQDDEFYVHWTETEWANNLTDTDFECFEVLFGGMLVGLVAFKTFGDSVTLERLVVDKKARNQGVARYILTQTLHNLETNGIHNVKLSLDSQNIPMLNLLMQFGFVKCGEQIDDRTKRNILLIKKDVI